MPVTIICPNCDARLTAPEAVLGKKVKCKKCDEPFVAKRPAVDGDEGDPPAKPSKAAARSRQDEAASPKKMKKTRRPADDDDSDVDGDDEPRPKAKKKGKKKAKQGSSAMLLVLLVVGAVVLIGGGIGVYFGFIKEEKPTESSTAGGDGVKGPPGGVKGTPGAPGAWVEHADAEGKYRISFPGRPTTQNQTVMVAGMQQTLKVTQLQAGAEIFVANAVVIPPGQDQDPEQLLNIAEQQAGAQVQNATVTSKQPITHAGVNGRELVLAIQSPAGPIAGVVRLFVNNGRIYTLGVVGPTVLASSPNVVKYFESLKFE